MKKSIKVFDRVCYGIIAATVAISTFGIVRGCVHAADENDDDLTETVYIVYTDENSHPYAVVTNPRIFEPVKPAFVLSESDRQRVAEIVAGQAGGKSVTCQTMIANVLYNQMLANGNKIDGTDYAKCGRGKPDDDTYAAVDAIFQRGEWLLDDTVMWTGDADDPDEWHQTLRLVTTCDGIAFYEVR